MRQDSPHVYTFRNLDPPPKDTNGQVPQDISLPSKPKGDRFQFLQEDNELIFPNGWHNSPMSIRMRFPSDISQRLPAEIDKQINLEMEELSKSLRPPPEMDEHRSRFVEKLQRILDIEWPDRHVTAHMFGSSKNGLGTIYSDVDVCLTMPKLDSNKKGEAVIELSHALSRHGMDRIQTISAARVPICKFFDPEFELHCDININNPMAIRNTELIRRYAEIDFRFAPLMVVLKHWTRRRALNDAARGGTLSTYCWTMMVINFLQMRHPPILPSLQEIYFQRLQANYSSVTPVFIDGVDCGFCTDEDVIREFRAYNTNEETLASLLFAFFRLFAVEFNYDYSVVSVRHGNIVTKASKGWECHHAAKQKRWFGVEEPFHPNRNLANALDGTGIAGLRLEFDRALCIMEQGLGLDAMCEEYSPSKARTYLPVHRLRLVPSPEPTGYRQMTRESKPPRYAGHSRDDEIYNRIHQRRGNGRSHHYYGRGGSMRVSPTQPIPQSDTFLPVDMATALFPDCQPGSHPMPGVFFQNASFPVPASSPPSEFPVNQAASQELPDLPEVQEFAEQGVDPQTAMPTTTLPLNALSGLSPEDLRRLSSLSLESAYLETPRPVYGVYVNRQRLEQYAYAMQHRRSMGAWNMQRFAGPPPNWRDDPDGSESSGTRSPIQVIIEKQPEGQDANEITVSEIGSDGQSRTLFSSVTSETGSDASFVGLPMAVPGFDFRTQPQAIDEFHKNACTQYPEQLGDLEIGGLRPPSINRRQRSQSPRYDEVVGTASDRRRRSQSRNGWSRWHGPRAGDGYRTYDSRDVSPSKSESFVVEQHLEINVNARKETLMDDRMSPVKEEPRRLRLATHDGSTQQVGNSTASNGEESVPTARRRNSKGTLLWANSSHRLDTRRGGSVRVFESSGTQTSPVKAEDDRGRTRNDRAAQPGSRERHRDPRRHSRQHYHEHKNERHNDKQLHNKHDRTPRPRSLSTSAVSGRKTWRSNDRQHEIVDEHHLKPRVVKSAAVSPGPGTATPSVIDDDVAPSSGKDSSPSASMKAMNQNVWHRRDHAWVSQWLRQPQLEAPENGKSGKDANDESSLDTKETGKEDTLPRPASPTKTFAQTVAEGTAETPTRKAESGSSPVLNTANPSVSGSAATITKPVTGTNAHTTTNKKVKTTSSHVPSSNGHTHAHNEKRQHRRR
ncbi:hypothetical protein HDU85_005307 [Gaertneriomyces sp. JEL0708]|nr:hypothetical protein HDU85_005307 [Gaertneriomyces sp. JEL0708]